MAVQNLGGITMKEVITFQTQVMMGAQFGRIASKQATKEDLLIACLRMAGTMRSGTLRKMQKKTAKAF